MSEKTNPGCIDAYGYPVFVKLYQKAQLWAGH